MHNKNKQTQLQLIRCNNSFLLKQPHPVAIPVKRNSVSIMALSFSAWKALFAMFNISTMNSGDDFFFIGHKE